MPKDLKVTLSDIEYKILNNIKLVEGSDGEKLRNLLRVYISTIPELKSSDYYLKRMENKEKIEGLLKNIWNEYETTDYPTELWTDDKINKLKSDLVEINVLMKTGENQFIPSNKFRSLFKMLLHDIVTENKDMDEYSAACVATIQLLMEFGADALSDETLRDGAIYLNEGWMFVYATAVKKAREFVKTKKLFPGVEVPVSRAKHP